MLFKWPLHLTVGIWILDIQTSETSENQTLSCYNLKIWPRVRFSGLGLNSSLVSNPWPEYQTTKSYFGRFQCHFGYNWSSFWMPFENLDIRQPDQPGIQIPTVFFKGNYSKSFSDFSARFRSGIKTDPCVDDFCSGLFLFLYFLQQLLLLLQRRRNSILD